MRAVKLYREQERFEMMEKDEKFKNDRIEVRRDYYKAGKKNKGGSAFNIITLDYENSKDGTALKAVDGDAQVRALMRSHVLDKKNNGSYNILTGVDRKQVTVPSHPRYNPISNAGREMISSSRRSHAPAQGVVPGLN